MSPAQMPTAIGRRMTSVGPQLGAGHAPSFICRMPSRTSAFMREETIQFSFQFQPVAWLEHDALANHFTPLLRFAMQPLKLLQVGIGIGIDVMAGQDGSQT